MSYDPRWENPTDDGMSPPPVDIQAAKAKVLGPAVGMFVIAAFGLLNVGLTAIQMGSMKGEVAAGRAQINMDPRLQPQQKQALAQYYDFVEKYVIPAMPISVGLTAISSLLTAFGGYTMMTLSGRGLAYTACILSAIPCTSGCCLLGLVFGIWGITALSDRNVMAAFRAKSAGEAY